MAPTGVTVKLSNVVLFVLNLERCFTISTLER